jgi:glycosyltransferase involved in cell wall biosynthesis
VTTTPWKRHDASGQPAGTALGGCDVPGICQNAARPKGPAPATAGVRPILMITGGGLENGGGIGRLIGYVVTAWNDQARGKMRVIDSRGPKYRRIVWPFFMLRSLWLVLRAAPERPILHVHLAGNFSTWRKLIIISVGRLLGLPYLLHLHDPKYEAFYHKQPRWRQAIVRSVFDHAARVIALGAPAADMSMRVFAVPAERIDILANAVPGPSHVPAREPQRAPAEPRILFLGQLQRRKGVHDLIEALGRAGVASQKWVATLAGGGPDQPGFEAQAEQLGIRERISFPGWLPRGPVTALLESADILVLPSYAEEMAMAVLEGMAYGLCVICTPVGAQAEVVENNISALVVPPGDIDALAAALARCIADPALRRRLGQGARVAYLRGYNIADYPARIAAIYDRIAM